MMRNTARVHFADALVGNGDRFHQLNTGNMFYVWRLSKQTRRRANPVGCIDNDSFLSTYCPRLQGGFKSVEDYVAKVLKPERRTVGLEQPGAAGGGMGAQHERA